MGYRVSATDMFDEVIYNIKTSDELRVAMRDKIEVLEASRTRREERMEKLREEYAIGPERLADLLLRFKNEGSSRSTSYDDQDPSAPIVPAGVIANLVRERDMLTTERDQRRKLELILRNGQPRGHFVPASLEQQTFSRQPLDRGSQINARNGPA